MTTLEQQLTKYLYDFKDWCPKGELLNIRWKNAQDFTYYLQSTTDRKLRLLEEQSIIAVKSNGKNSLLYKYIPQEMRPRYLHPKERTSEKLFRQ